MVNKLFIYAFAVTLAVCGSVYADCTDKFMNQSNNISCAQKLQSYTIHTPSGLRATAVLTQEINSKTALAGQIISAVFTEDFKYKNQLIAPCGSVISGNIVYSKKAGMPNKPAEVQVRFTTIRTPYNNIIPISALIATSDKTGVLKGESAVKKIAKSANSNKTVYDEAPKTSSIKRSISKPQPDDVLITESKDVETVLSKGGNILIPSNSKIDLLFDQPVTLSAQ